MPIHMGGWVDVEYNWLLDEWSGDGEDCLGLDQMGEFEGSGGTVWGRGGIDGHFYHLPVLWQPGREPCAVGTLWYQLLHREGCSLRDFGVFVWERNRLVKLFRWGLVAQRNCKLHPRTLWKESQDDPSESLQQTLLAHLIKSFIIFFPHKEWYKLAFINHAGCPK